MNDELRQQANAEARAAINQASMLLNAATTSVLHHGIRERGLDSYTAYKEAAAELDGLLEQIRDACMKDLQRVYKVTRRAA